MSACSLVTTNVISSIKTVSTGNYSLFLLLHGLILIHIYYDVCAYVMKISFTFSLYINLHLSDHVV